MAQKVIPEEEAAGYKLEDNTNILSNLTEDGKIYGLKYNGFIPILVNAVQELSAEVTALKAEVAALKGE